MTEENARQAERARVFFALWPDACCAERLQQVTRQLVSTTGGGRPTEKSTLHLTLAFVGTARGGAEDRLADLRDIASDVQAALSAVAAEPWTLNRLAYWRHNRILWAGSDRIPAALALLAEQLASRLQARGYALPVRPFVPHITLLRKLDRVPPPEALQALENSLLPWRYSRFELLQSLPSQLSPDGSRYATLGAWELPQQPA